MGTRTIKLDLSPESIEFVETYQEEKGLETFDDAVGALLVVGVHRLLALSKNNEKKRQAERFKKGEIKTAPSFEPRKNQFPDLVKAPEEKPEPPPKGGKKVPKPAKEEKAPKVPKAVKPPKTSLSKKLAKPAKEAKPKKVAAKPSKIESISGDPANDNAETESPKPEEPKAILPDHYEEAKAWVAEQKAKGLIVKPTDLTRNYGWAFNRAKAFLDEQKAA